MKYTVEQLVFILAFGTFLLLHLMNIVNNQPNNYSCHFLHNSDVIFHDFFLFC